MFINEHARLTIVECKLWKNPQSRREVVAQTLDYVAALSSWTYADLQRQVSGGHLVTDDSDEDSDTGKGDARGGRKHLKEWWLPVLSMTFDDPEQERPYWVATNNAVLKTPFPGILIKAYALKANSTTGVFLSGSRIENVEAVRELIKRDTVALKKELPEGTEIDSPEYNTPVQCSTNLPGDDERRAWIIETLNTFVNVLRPRLKRCYAEAYK